ncbi:MAG: hypothetical protein JNK38_01880 [Acidobacteria bacterium]|nr:hypothetical protein [Acidobacteriota bacterium]
MDRITEFIKLANDNEGFIAVVLFVTTLLLGWISGIFQSLRRRPKFKITVIEGPSFCCTFETGREHNSHKAHRTAIALYLTVSNTGSAPSNIQNIQVGYHNFTFKYSFLWFWITKPAVALEDFQVMIGDNIKIYPFLLQKNRLSPSQPDTFLEIGKSTTGVVYFEQDECWGGFYPRDKVGNITIKIKIEDVFGKSHTRKTSIPKLSLPEASRFNPQFGKTFESLLAGQEKQKVEEQSKTSEMN